MTDYAVDERTVGEATSPYAVRALSALGQTAAATCKACLHMLLPRGCAGCDAPDEVLCRRCRSEFTHPRRRDLPEASSQYGYGCGAYHGVVRHAILQWKDHGDEECTKTFAELLVDLMMLTIIERFRGSGDMLIVPVPSTSRSVARRGRWHMFPLAGALAMLLRREGYEATVSPLLRMGRSAGKAVQTAGAAERMGRVKDALSCRGLQVVRGRPVLLVDDIVTTGATMRRCVHLLRTNGIEVVTSLALAHTVESTAH